MYTWQCTLAILLINIDFLFLQIFRLNISLSECQYIDGDASYLYFYWVKDRNAFNNVHFKGRFKDYIRIEISTGGNTCYHFICKIEMIFNLIHEDKMLLERKRFYNQQSVITIIKLLVFCKKKKLQLYTYLIAGLPPNKYYFFLSYNHLH